MEDRNYILDRLISRSMSKEEFDFEKLACPPISWIFSWQDINDLYQIATSLRYSARPDIKYKLIDQIMTKRGFEKFQAGTNRVTYRFLEDQSFVAKVAYSKQSCRDNLREFQNQRFLKPFVTKVFEVVPSGVLGFFERVKPINSREEFFSVAEDIFTLITEFLVGEYVLDDIGTKYFMNYGIRVTHSKGGGPVLLDFPYVYKLDGNKIFCNAPNEFSPTGRCDGEIDYDDGFNTLRCCKCGVEYKAYELKKAEDEDKIIVKTKGGQKMKIRTSGGSGEDRVVEIGNNEVKSTPKKPIKEKKDNVTVSFEGKEVKSSGIKIKVVEPECPIEYDPSLIQPEMQVKDSRPEQAKEKESEEPKEEEVEVVTEETNPLLAFLDHIEKAWNLLPDAYSENHYKVDEFMMSLITVYKQNRSSSIKYIMDDLKSIFDEFEFVNEDEGGTVFDPDKDSEFFNIVKNNMPSSFISALIEIVVKNHINDISLKCVAGNSENECIPAFMVDVLPIIYGEPYKFVVEESAEEEDAEEETEETEIEENDSDDVLNGFAMFAAETVNIKDLFPDEKRRKNVFAIIGPDGKYVTVGDNELLAIDKLDNRAVNNLSVVPKSWYTVAVEKLGKIEEEENNTKEAPIGVTPPNEVEEEEAELSVNGVTEE